MAKTAVEFAFSPSLNHRYVMDNTTQSPAYDGGDVAAWQDSLRPKVEELLGMPDGDRVPLDVRSLWKRVHPLGAIEKLVFTSEPYADVMGYLCLPKDAKKPYPFFVCVQGHSSGVHNSIAVDQEDETTPIEVDGDRDFGLGCMRSGVAALCIEQRSFGVRGESHQERVSTHGCHDATMHALMLGRTLLGERVFDVDRALDYLETRDDVDWSRVGVMGNSGGGTVSTFAAAILPRITFAMPSCYFCTFRDSIMSIYHCADNYVPGLYKYAEMADVLGLFAPRPVVVVAGQHDQIFPIGAVHEAFGKLKEIYAAAGAEDRCHLVVGPEGHRFYSDLAWPAKLKELNR